MNKRGLRVLCSASLLVSASSVCTFSGLQSLFAQSSTEAPLQFPRVEMLSPSTTFTECKSLNVQLLAPRSAVLEKGVAILESRIRERSGVEFAFNQGADCGVVLDLQKGIGTEGPGNCCSNSFRRSSRLSRMSAWTM